jgi:tight adherence protein C
MSSLVDTMLQGTAFLGTAALALLASQTLLKRLVIRDRLTRGATPAPVESVIRQQDVRNRFLKWVQGVTSLSELQERNKLRAELSRAGFENPAAAIWFVMIRYGLALGLPLLLLGLRAAMHQQASGIFGFMQPFVLCLLGLFGPRWWLKSRIGEYRRKVERQFPDGLDLLVICVDAGLGLEAAINRVASEMRRSHPQIAREFERVSEEMGAGRSCADALRGLAERLDMPSIRGFVSLLVQSQNLGASIAQGLRTYAVDMRHTRALRAEEKAMRIPVLMSVPLVSCFLPVIIVALLLPPMIDIVRQVLPSMHGFAK